MQTLAPRRPVCINLNSDGSIQRNEAQMTREQTLDRIFAMNPTATSEFLDCFDDECLGEYLDHLNAASQPRGRMAIWVRPTRNRAVVTAPTRD